LVEGGVKDSENNMNAVARFLKKLSMLLRRKKFSSELQEEMAFHREQKERDLVAGGTAPEAAHYAAMREFGNEALLRDRSHEVVGFRWETVLQDLHFAFRQLRKNPGFTATATLMLALGIGASAAIFAFVDAALVKPLPYRDPTRLVYVTESAGTLIPRANLSYLDYLDWKKLNQVLDSFDVYTGNGYLLRTNSGTEMVTGARVSGGFLQTLGVTPILGRNIKQTDDQPNAPDTVMLMYATWQKRFGGRKDIVGQPITLSGTPYTVVGVLPADFQFAPRAAAEFFAPLHTPNTCEKRRGCHNLEGIGRLKDGVSFATALADFTAIAKQLEVQYPDLNRGQGAYVLPLSEIIRGDIRPILLALLGGAALLLLIACVNVSSLLLVRSESRRREIAVRGALGASPARLARLFITEGFVLATGGGICGLGAAYVAVRVLLALLPKDIVIFMPFLQGLGINTHTLVFAAALALLSAMLFALTPLVRLSQTDIRADLAEGACGTAGVLWRRFGANLVVVELAIAVVLLAGAGLLAKSFYKLLHVDIGFDPEHLATLQIALPDQTYPKDPQLLAVQKRILESVSALPGVKSAAVTSALPVSFNGNTDWIRLAGKPYHGEHNEVNEREVSPEFLATLHARLMRGRFFTEKDDASSPAVTVINEKLAKMYFPGEDPIGKQIGDIKLSKDSLREVIGVVNDVKEGALDSEIWPAEYLSSYRNPDDYLILLVRTTQEEVSVLQSIIRTIQQIDPGIGTVGEMTMNQHIDESQTAYIHRTAAWLVGGFATLALLLGGVGLYGVIAYSVSRRTREIGVRIALGAQRTAVYKLILKEAGWLTVVGIVAGLVCSLGAAALMKSLLFGVHAWDVSTLATVAGILAVAALLASFFPARRAASVNPVEALRAE
jgi:predicted permease